MRRSLFFGLIAILGLVGCSRNQEIDIPDANLSLYARTESPAETKTIVEEGVYVFWEPGEEIAVFMGEKVAKFTTDITASSGTATFKGTFGDSEWPEEPDLWAVYPFSEEAVFDGETITIILPSEQVAREGSFGKDMNLAIAHSNSSTIQFYNVGGGIRFSVTEEGIKKVMFEGLSGEIISGKVKIGMDENGKPVVQEVTGGSQFITLLPPTGQESFEPDAWYYIVAIPGSLDGGYKLRFYKDTHYARKVSEKAVQIKRSIYGNIEKADEGIEYEAQTLHFPETETEWKESAEITKSIGRIAGVLIDSLRNNSHSSAADYIETLQNIEGVLDVWVDSENDLVAIMQKDSLVVNYPNPRKFLHSPESIDQGDYATVSSISRNGSLNGKRKSAPCLSSSGESFKGKKAIILIPCEQPGTDYYTYHNNYLRECLLDMGYSSENIVSKLGPDAGIEFFSGEELSKYDYIHITTHGDVGYYTYQKDKDKRRQGTCFASASEYDVSWVVSNLASKRIKKDDIALMYCDHVFDGIEESKYYVCMTSDFINDASFDNSCILITACHSAATVNGVVGGTILSEFYDNGAGVASGYLHTGHGGYTEPFTRFITRLLCHGISYQDAVNYLQNSSWFDAYILKGCIEKQRYKLRKQEITMDEYQSYLVDVSHNSYFYFPLPEKATQPYYLNELGFEINEKVSVSNGSAIFNWEFDFIPFVEEFSYDDYSIFERHTDVISYDVQYDVHIDNNIVLSSKDATEKSVIWDSPTLGDHTWYVIAKIVEGDNIISTYKSDKKQFTINEQKPDPPQVETFPASVDVGYVFLSGDVTNRSLEGLETGFYYYKMTAEEAATQLSSEDSLGLALSGKTILSTGDYKDYFGVNLTDIEKNSKYLFMAYAKDEYNQMGQGRVLSFVVDGESHQDYAIPDAVDLGLPSGLKWASFNLGASKPEEYGDYYAWGETEPYYSSLDPLTWKEGKGGGYAWSSYKWCMGTSNTMTKYCSMSSYGYNGFTDNKTVLDLEDDAVHVNLGGTWRMPTVAEWTELREKCTWTWTTQNGVRGRLVTGSNGNSIFLPAAGCRDGTYLDYVGSRGYYWSSSLGTGSPYGAWIVYFHSGNVLGYREYRFDGFSVRPVSE